tara:strand:+ start:644 stop:1225 length:582 start_codon:yes stop_codon:yes gene_type:complete
MPLWGTTHDSATNKPKWAPTDENSDYSKGDIYATNSGWVQQAGTAASGNDNTDADPEVLVAIGGLAGTSGTTGLRAATATSMRFVQSSYAAGSRTITVEVTWDEGVTVTGTPQLVVDNDSRANHTLSYTATGSTANRKRFTAASQTVGEDDVLTIGGSNVTLNGGTIKDTASGSVNSSLVLSGLTAVTSTVTA